MTESDKQDRLIDLTAEIIAAHVSNNQISSDEIAPLVGEVYAALKAAVDGTGAEPQPVVSTPQRAVSVRKSLASPDHIISMIDGKPYKTLKRHIGLHGYTPQSYRETFGLAKDYPMTCPSYSEQRAEMAKRIGLGRKSGQKRGRRPNAK